MKVVLKSRADGAGVAIFALMLCYGYYWKTLRVEHYMKIRMASEMVYCLYRLILQENEILFPCNRRLEQYVEMAPDKPENFVPMCRAFCETFDDALFDRILAAYKAWTRWPHPTDLNIIASRRQLDFEKWWYIPRPLIAEW